jgi:hypothetical protein
VTGARTRGGDVDQSGDAVVRGRDVVGAAAAVPDEDGRAADLTQVRARHGDVTPVRVEAELLGYDLYLERTASPC